MSVIALEPEVAEWVGRLTALTGETENDAILQAVQERMKRLAEADAQVRLRRMRAVVDRYARRPLLDSRTADEITGYDENGHFD